MSESARSRLIGSASTARICRSMKLSANTTRRIVSVRPRPATRAVDARPETAQVASDGCGCRASGGFTDDDVSMEGLRPPNPSLLDRSTLVRCAAGAEIRLVRAKPSLPARAPRYGCRVGHVSHFKPHRFGTGRIAASYVGQLTIVKATQWTSSRKLERASPTVSLEHGGQHRVDSTVERPKPMLRRCCVDAASYRGSGHKSGFAAVLPKPRPRHLLRLHRPRA